jgi:protein-disulfide isomerase
MAVLRVPVSPSEHISGGEYAPVTLVECGDYQCPYCAEAFPIFEMVRKYFGDRLRFVFRHFPLTEVHPFAEYAAETAEFASAQGLFWQMHGLLYANQPQLTVAVLLASARALGLSEATLEAALADRTYAPKVHEYILGGVRSGVNSTPAFFIQGGRHDGSYDYESLTGAISAAV